MKTKRFYSYLLAAFCCLCAVFALTSCHPDDEEDDNNGNDHGSKTKIEYIEFKEPCLNKYATRDEVKAWMAINMPEYEICVDIESALNYAIANKPINNVIYSFYNGRLLASSCSGAYKYEKVVDFLCAKYGERETESITMDHGVTYESYEYHPNIEEFDWISLHYIHGKLDVADVLYDEVHVSFYF